MPPSNSSVDLSIVIPARNEAENLSTLMPEINKIVSDMGIYYEILVVDECADDSTSQVVNLNGGRLLCPASRGYGMAILNGMRQALGAYILTIDADFSHPPVFIRNLWEARKSADIIIASRYVQGGKAIMPFTRYLLSRVLNRFFQIGLGIPVRDMSSGYRLYSDNAVAIDEIECTDFDILEEILVKAIINGKKISEIAFTYAPRRHGSSHARVFKFGLLYLKTFGRLWRLRHFRH